MHKVLNYVYRGSPGELYRIWIFRMLKRSQIDGCFWIKVFNVSQSRRHGILGLRWQCHGGSSWSLRSKNFQSCGTSWVELSARSQRLMSCQLKLFVQPKPCRETFLCCLQEVHRTLAICPDTQQRNARQTSMKPKKLKEMGPPKWNSHLFSIFLSAPQHNFLSVLEPWKRTVKSMNDDDKQNLDWIFAIAFSHFSSRSERNRLKPPLRHFHIFQLLFCSIRFHLGLDKVPLTKLQMPMSPLCKWIAVFARLINEWMSRGSEVRTSERIIKRELHLRRHCMINLRKGTEHKDSKQGSWKRAFFLSRQVERQGNYPISYNIIIVS